MHILKLKNSQYALLIRHNERQNEHYSNENIDRSKTHLNVLLLSDGEENYRTMLEEDAEEREKQHKSARRSDAVTCASCVVTLPKEYEGKTYAEKVEFFEATRELLSLKFGRENELSIALHYDETTPHMHYAFAPRKDKILNAKSVLDRRCFQSLHDYVDKGLRARLDWYHGGVVAVDVEERLSAKDNLQLKDYKELQAKKDETIEETKEAKKELAVINNNITMQSRRLDEVKELTSDYSDKVVNLLKSGEDVKLHGEDKKLMRQAIESDVVARLTAEITEKDKKLKEQQKTLEQVSVNYTKLANNFALLAQDFGDSLTLMHNSVLPIKEQTLDPYADNTQITNDETVKEYERLNTNYKKARTTVDYWASNGLKLGITMHPAPPSLLVSLKTALQRLKNELQRKVSQIRQSINIGKGGGRDGR